jgi:hypothetical protein
LVNTSGGPHELWMNSWTLNLQETHGLCSEFYEGFHGIVPLKLAKPRLVSNMSGVICILFCLVGNQAKSIRNIFFFLDLHDLFFFHRPEVSNEKDFLSHGPFFWRSSRYEVRNGITRNDP